MDLILFHEKVKDLTGSEWVPYPSELFIEVILKIDNLKAIELIEERRKYTFPFFLDGDPQWGKLLQLKRELEHG